MYSPTVPYPSTLALGMNEKLHKKNFPPEESGTGSPFEGLPFIAIFPKLL